MSAVAEKGRHLPPHDFLVNIKIANRKEIYEKLISNIKSIFKRIVILHQADSDDQQK
jgi:hypothetical protein